jgi:hypothetical protein
MILHLQIMNQLFAPRLPLSTPRMCPRSKIALSLEMRGIFAATGTLTATHWQQITDGKKKSLTMQRAVISSSPAKKANVWPQREHILPRMFSVLIYSGPLLPRGTFWPNVTQLNKTSFSYLWEMGGKIGTMA